MTHGKTYNKSPRRINYKATKSKTNTGTTALERLLTSGVKLHTHWLNVVVYFFLNSANLICRGMDISRCFRESFGIRDNESR